MTVRDLPFTESVSQPPKTEPSPQRDQSVWAYSDAERGSEQYVRDVYDRIQVLLDIDSETDLTTIASRIYQRSKRNRLHEGNGYEPIALAAFYITLQIDELPYSIDSIQELGGVDKRKLIRKRNQISRTLNLEIPPTNPRTQIGIIVDDLPASRETAELADGILADAPATFLSGKNPTALAASALYAAALLTGDSLCQSQISDAANISTVSIRTHYRRLLAVTEHVPVTQNDLDDIDGRTNPEGIQQVIETDSTQSEYAR